MVLESFQFLDSGGRGSEEGAPAPVRNKVQAAAPPPETGDEHPTEDDVPF